LIRTTLYSFINIYQTDSRVYFIQTDSRVYFIQGFISAAGRVVASNRACRGQGLLTTSKIGFEFRLMALIAQMESIKIPSVQA